MGGDRAVGPRQPQPARRLDRYRSRSGQLSPHGAAHRHGRRNFVDGIEDAADHPERPVHTHLEYGRPDDLAPQNGSDGLAGPASSGWRVNRPDGEAKGVDVENLPDESSME